MKMIGYNVMLLCTVLITRRIALDASVYHDPGKGVETKTHRSKNIHLTKNSLVVGKAGHRFRLGTGTEAAGWLHNKLANYK